MINKASQLLCTTIASVIPRSFGLGMRYERVMAGWAED